MSLDRTGFPPLDTDDLDARLDRRAAARGIPTLRIDDTAPAWEAERVDDVGHGLALVETGLAELAGQGAPVPAARPGVQTKRRVPRPIVLKTTTSAPVPEVPTPRSRMKSLNVELPDYVWVELKSRAAREMVSVRHVIMTLLDEAGIDIAAVDLIEDGRRLR